MRARRRSRHRPDEDFPHPGRDTSAEQGRRLSDEQSAYGTSLGALLFSLIGSAAWLWLTFRFLWREDPLWFFLLFFVVGISWLLGSIVLALQWARFGKVTLSVVDPVSPGGKLRAVLRSRFGAAREVTAVLECKRVSWRNYYNENLPHEELVWSRRARFSVLEQGQCRVEIDVPANAEPTREHQYNIAARGINMTWQTPGIRWNLKVRVPGWLGLERDFSVEVIP